MYAEFNETTDLYLRLLRQAQEVEDPRLVGMILVRLKQVAPHKRTTDCRCAVIPFPAPIAPPEAIAEEPCFWPRLAATQVGIIVALYSLVVAGHSFFS